jgi:alpha-tubulin suppressor-like RCC1 family protein
MTTTNASVTQMFYRVQRLLGSPIAAGSDFSVVIRSDGTLWAWGDNGGELGDGLGGENQPVEPYLPYPGEVANVIPCAGQAITNAVAVAAGGDDYTVVVDANGAVWAFGESDGGQLGNGVSCYGCVTNSPAPVQVIGASNIVAVAAGFEHTLALCNAGTVTAWGNNSDTQDAEDEANLTGQLGIGYQLAPYITNVPVASQFPTGVMIVAIAAGSYHSVALDNAGNVWTFGENLNGQLGNGLDECITQLNVTAPMMLTTISNVIAIAAGLNHTIVLRADKTVWTWGDDSRGELGRTLGGSGCSYDDPLPGQVAASGLSNNVVAIAAGAYFSLAVTSNGQVYAWGDNQLGELGTDGPTEVYTQMLVAGISNVVWASAPRANDPYNNGGLHSLVMTLDQGTNHYWGWGDNTEGEIGNATTSGNETNYNYYEGSPPAPYVTTPTGPVQFCTRCQRTVQLGTSGSFTAQCNGTLYLYFNGQIGNFNGYAGSFTVSFDGLPTNVNVAAYDPSGYGIGIAVGAVTNGGFYNYSATGTCYHTTSPFSGSDANGNDTNNTPWNCSDFNIINKTNAICPTAQCFSLVGKIQ